MNKIIIANTDYSIIQPSASSQISSELEYASVAHSEGPRQGKGSMSSSLYKKYLGESGQLEYGLALPMNSS